MKILQVLKSNRDLVYMIALILLAIYGVFTSMHIWEQDKQKLALQSALKETQAELTYRKNKEGKLISDKFAAEQRMKDMEKNMPAFAEAVSKALDIKIKNLKAGVIAEFKAHGEGKAEFQLLEKPIASSLNLRPADSTYIVNNSGVVSHPFEPFSLIINDGYLSEQIDIYSADNAPYHYEYADTLTFAFHVKKKWLLGRKQLYSSGSLANPNARITNSQAVLVKEYKDRRWSIGPAVTYGWGSDGAQTIIGVSVQYGVIKF